MVALGRTKLPGLWGFGVWGLGFWGLGFGVWGLGFGVWGLGFGVWGLGFFTGRVLVVSRCGNVNGAAKEQGVRALSFGIRGLNPKPQTPNPKH